MKKRVLLFLNAVVLALLLNISVIGSENQSLFCYACEGGVVNKAAGETFTVEIKFKNVGSTEGTWSVNVAFEGEKWTWTATPKNLTLKAGQTRILTWKGNVSPNAPVGSISRLVVYYGDYFQALNWWILVVENAELAITSSIVR
ncbi:MAG: hypothetical protein QXJ02_00270 [Candidatus Bathyarchaeia archaeon]